MIPEKLEISALKNITPPCRVLEGFEPAKAGWSYYQDRSWLAPITSPGQGETFLVRVGTKLNNQHHEHSRVPILYHNFGKSRLDST